MQPLPGAIQIQTSMIAAAVPMGNDTEGAIQLTIFQVDGPPLQTLIGPNLCLGLLRNLALTLSNMPNPPQPGPGLADMLAVPGVPTTSKQTATYFGQQYPADVIQSLGMLMVRANLLERDLIQLLSALSGMSSEASAAAFYSSQNANARIQMLRALIPTSKANTAQATRIEKALDKVRSAFDRRNELVHAQWNFKNDKFETRYFTPANKEKAKPVVVTAKSIERLAADYREAGLRIIAEASTVGGQPHPSPETPPTR